MEYFPVKVQAGAEIYGYFPEARRAEDGFGRERKCCYVFKKRFDVSNLYDYIASRRGKYAVCFDLVGLMYINDTFGRPAGDAAIAECLRRIDEAAGENMLPIRIGGDEFVLITDFSDIESARTAADKILAKNDGTVISGENTVKVSMRAGFAVIPEKINYNELFDKFIIAGCCR